MRKAFGFGTPRSLQPEGPLAALTQTAWLLLARAVAFTAPTWPRRNAAPARPTAAQPTLALAA